MNIKTILISVLLSVLLSFGGAWIYLKSNNSKIGYIKSAIILRDYKGMVAVTEQYNAELKMVQTNLDTLRNRFQNLQSVEGKVKGKDKEIWSYQIGAAQTEYEKYNQQAAEQMQNRRNELTTKVLTTINDYIHEYGVQNNYKLILGTTEDGSILYGDEADDLTNKILEELNAAYDKNSVNKK